MIQVTDIALKAAKALAVAIFFPATILAQPQKSAELPVEVFAALPSFADPQLSLSGDYLAFFASGEGRTRLIARSMTGGSPLVVVPPENQTIIDFQWLKNDILIFRTSYSLKRRSMKVRTTETRVHRLDLRTKKSLWLGTPNRSTLQKTNSQHERVIDTLPQDPNHVLIELDLNRNNLYEIYKVSLASAHKKIHEKERTYVQDWLTDPTSTVRFATGFRRSKAVRYLKDDRGEWLNLEDFAWASKYSIEGFSPDPDIAYVSGRTEHGTRGLFLLKLSTGEITKTLFAHKRFDLNRVARRQSSGEIVGAVYIDDFPRTVYFDERLKQVQRTIDAELPDTVNTILSEAPDKDWYFISAKNATSPGSYYIFDRPNAHIRFVESKRQDIDPAKMAKTERVSVPTRDGETIPAYLTRPKTHEPHFEDTDNKPAAVIMPHGGPYGIRDTAEWDYFAQFLASRGYVVMKPNFRGSGGYGSAFARAGRDQWGGLMQDDITDATNWLINSGDVDPNRVCILGASYGGYAALMALVQQPALYRCAVSVNGVTDLKRMKSNDRRNAVGGHTWTNAMRLEGVSDRDISPYDQAKKIIAPILLMSSVDDARVPFQYAVDMHEKLKKIGKESQYVRIEKGTHNMTTAQSRLTMLKAIETFLAKHIGD